MRNFCWLFEFYSTFVCSESISSSIILYVENEEFTLWKIFNMMGFLHFEDYALSYPGAANHPLNSKPFIGEKILLTRHTCEVTGKIYSNNIHSSTINNSFVPETISNPRYFERDFFAVPTIAECYMLELSLDKLWFCSDWKEEYLSFSEGS